MSNHTVTQAAAFHALADPTRRAVLDLLRTHGSQPAGRIAACFPVSRPAISKHLRLLREARLVREHRRGRHHYYQLDPEPLRAVDSWLASYRAFWSGRLHQLKAFIEAEPTAELSRSCPGDRRSAKPAVLRLNRKAQQHRSVTPTPHR